MHVHRATGCTYHATCSPDDRAEKAPCVLAGIGLMRRLLLLLRLTAPSLSPSKHKHKTQTQNRYLFGGRTAESMAARNVNLNDLWRFDLTKRAWTLLTPSGRAPEQR